MGTKVGVLGTSTTASATTTAAYTVPAGKTAKVKVMYRGVSGTNSTLSIVVNGILLFTTSALTNGHIHHSSKAAMYETQTSATGVDGTTDEKTVAPAPQEFYLDAGDVVQYIIGTDAFTSFQMDVVGVEMDKSGV